jgi:type II secretory pathway pseudopilin PulG
MLHNTSRFFSQPSIRLFGLLSVLMGTVGLGAIACLSPPPPSSNPTTTGPQGELNDIKTTMVGEWERIPDPNQAGGSVPRWMFTGNNQLVVFDLNGPGSGLAQSGTYSINTEVSPMQLDIVFPDDDEVFFTIFEVVNDGILKVQRNDSGMPRPREFDGRAVTLQKISNAASVTADPSTAPTTDAPTTEQEVPSFEPNYEQQTAIARQSEAKQTIAMINRAQQAYFLETAAFTQTPSALGIPFDSDSEDYRYELMTQNNQTVAFVEASARLSGLKSYTGVVALIQNNDTQVRSTLGVMCETTNPSRTPPRFIIKGNDISCASESQEVRF